MSKYSLCTAVLATLRASVFGVAPLFLLFACTAMPPGAGTSYSFKESNDAVRGTETVRYGSSSRPVESRPGLGTEYGEYRGSRVSDADFVRASSSPAARTSIYYNDRAGIDAMMGGRRLKSRVRSFDAGPAQVTIRGGGWSGALPGYEIGGRNYVAGESGERYEIVVKNSSSRRIEVVLSVDGLDVIDGQAASASKRGYIIAPRSSMTIEGWRRSMSGVAAFRFGSVSDSYAARSGAGTRNVGVIGVAVFAEKVHRYYHGGGYESGRRHAADPFPGESGGGRFARPPRG